MKNLLFNLMLLFILTVLELSCNNEQLTCTVNGSIMGRSSDTLVIIRSGANPDVTELIVPLVDSAFEFSLNGHYGEAYDIIFKEELNTGWHPVTFFIDRKRIMVKLYSYEESNKNQIMGGPLNRELARFHKMIENKYGGILNPISDSIDDLYNKGELYNKAIDTLFTEYDSTKDEMRKAFLAAKYEEMKRTGMIYTPKGRELILKFDSLNKEKETWRFNYFGENHTLVSYHFLLMDYRTARLSETDTASIHRLLPLFIDKFPSHPYTRMAQDLMEGDQKIRIGGHFIDFTLPDLNGKENKISDLIQDRIALLDFWATWCGPCIRTSRSMIPVYQEFKNSGFTIVGIAGEINDTDRLVAHLEREKYPWINLVEIDYKHGIWDKYNISNSAGMTLLVDRQGRILAINPTAVEVRAKLQKLFGTQI